SHFLYHIYHLLLHSFPTRRSSYLSQQFFNDPMLSVYLYSEVSKQRYFQLKAHFEDYVSIDLDQYQDVTRTFTDVFKVPNKSMTVDTQPMDSEEAYGGMDLSHVHFDFETLYDLIQNHFISTKIINHEAQTPTTQIESLYGITPAAMNRLIGKSITSGQTLSFEELRKHARTYYLIEDGQQLPKLNAQETNYHNNENSGENIQPSDASNNWSKQLDETSPIDMLGSWSEYEPTTQQKYFTVELIE